MSRLLVVHHSPTPTVRAVTDAVVAGTRDDAIGGVEVVVREALEATAGEVLAADRYLLGTTANFGYMSGALKHFFDTIFLDLARGNFDVAASAATITGPPGRTRAAAAIQRRSVSSPARRSARPSRAQPSSSSAAP